MDRSIEKPVGDGQKARNLYNDVVTIQQLLNDITPANGGANPPLKVDGVCGPKTKGAIQKFQLQHFGWKLADARVDPGGETLAKMNAMAAVSEYASIAFRIRRWQEDSEEVPPTRPQIFHVQYLESPSFRNAIYSFASLPVAVNTAAYPLPQFRGGWNVVMTRVPLTIRNLGCKARQTTMVIIPQTPWGPPDDYYKINPGHAMEFYLPSGTVYARVIFETDVSAWGQFTYAGDAP
jgi:peptidoglycan hydrolase-like protein with peptidoglycan-binding domain